jgi:hypothetical protein
MAFDPSSLLLKLSPTKEFDLLGSLQQSQQMSAQRQQMRLAREKFDFDKKQAEENKRLRELEEQGQMARARMQAEREREQAQAVKDAALLAEQQKQLGEFGKLAGTGQVQQADAMSPLLDQLGYNLNNLGGVGGLPVYQLENRAQAAAEAAAIEQARAGGDEMAGLGYPTNERGTLDDTQASQSTLPDDPSMLSLGGEDPALDEATSDALMPGEADLATSEEFAGDAVADVNVQAGGLGVAQLSGQDPFARALASSRQAAATGMPTRAPDEEDYMGAVPRNVIDLPAMNAQTLARLNPALQARIGALPPELQEGAKANAAAIGGLGYEAKDALKEFDTAMQDPVDIYKGQQNIEAQKAKGEELGRMDKSTLRKRGAEPGEALYKERRIDKALNSTAKADEVTRVLSNDNREDDGMVASAVMDAQNVVGAPSNTDLEFAFGIPKGSLLTQGVAWLEEKIAGGMSEPQKAAIKSYMKAVKETQERNLTEYLDNSFQLLDNGSLDPEERNGLRDFIERSVPKHVYNRYWEEREKRDEGRGRTSQSAPVDAGDLDSDKLGRVIGHESKGDPTATSVAGASGTMQIMPENLRAMGIEPEEFKKLSPAEQMPYNIRYLKERGITKDSSAEDYAMAVAAPAPELRNASNDTVVYPKSDDPKSAWAQNPGWRPADGGDITKGSILAFYGLGGGKGGGETDKRDLMQRGPHEGGKRDLVQRTGDAPSPITPLSNKMPEPKTPQEKRYLDLIAKKRGG